MDGSMCLGAKATHVKVLAHCASCTEQIRRKRGLPLRTGDFVWSPVTVRGDLWPAVILNLGFTCFSEPRPYFVHFFHAVPAKWAGEGDVVPWEDGMTRNRSAKRTVAAVALAEAAGAPKRESRSATARALPESLASSRSPRPVKRPRQRRIPDTQIDATTPCVSAKLVQSITHDSKASFALITQLQDMKALLAELEGHEQELQKKIARVRSAAAPQSFW